MLKRKLKHKDQNFPFSRACAYACVYAVTSENELKYCSGITQAQGYLPRLVNCLANEITGTRLPRA